MILIFLFVVIGEDELDDSTNEDENEEDSNDSSEAEDEDADEDEAEQEGDEAEEDDGGLKFQIKVEVEEEGNDSQRERAVLNEDLENFQFEDEVKTEQDDQNPFDVKAMTIGDIEKILQDQSREIKALKVAKKEEIVECRKKIRSKCLETDTMKRKLKEMTEEKNDLKTTNEKLQSLNRTYKARCDSLSRQNYEHEVTNVAYKLLKNENENLQRKLEESSKEKESLKELARNKINEMTKEMDRLKQSAQDATEKFKTELQTISEARNKAVTECERLTGENKAIVKDNDKLVDEKILYARKVRELAKESEEAQKKVQELAVESKAAQENQQQIINNLLQEKEKLLACNQQVAQSNQYLKRKVESMNEKNAEREDMKVKLLRMIEEDL